MTAQINNTEKTQWTLKPLKTELSKYIGNFFPLFRFTVDENCDSIIEEYNE